jgi:signal peptidase I
MSFQLLTSNYTSEILIMFNFRSKDQFDFGAVSINDDRDIEVHKFKRESKQGLWIESVRLLRDIVLIISIFILFGVFIAQPVVVEGTSMVPELHNGERLLVNKLVYYNIESFSWGHVERGDIVVFWYPNDPNKSFVKRVIGLPGDTVEVRNGIVFINGTQLNEPYLDIEHNKNLPSHQPVEVEDHYYFVMGDNRDNSSDSRVWGLVPEKYIYGKAFFRYWRPSGLGFLNKGDADLNDGGSQTAEDDFRADIGRE